MERTVKHARQAGRSDRGATLGTGETETRFRAMVAECSRRVVELTPDQLDRLALHFRLLRQWNRRVNLVSVKDVEELASLHYCESVFLASLLPAGRLGIADVGSGAGFPGYVIAIARPELRVALIEVDVRKAVFLREASRALTNVRVIEARAEVVKDRFDWIVARGVRWKSVLELVPRLAPAVALLLGREDAEEIVRHPGVHWREAIALPWRRAGYVVLGETAGG